MLERPFDDFARVHAGLHERAPKQFFKGNQSIMSIKPKRDEVFLAVPQKVAGEKLFDCLGIIKRPPVL